MNFAIIAAGEGSRLASEGVATPKPLVPIQGTPMIERMLHIFERAGAKRIVVCINDFMPEVREFLENFQPAEGVELILRIKSTPSSMHTFKEVSESLKGLGRFITVTVDTIFREEDFRRYVEAWEKAPEDVDAMMAVTDFVDDEKPLWIDADPRDLHIRAFLDTNTPDTRFISGGIYGLSDPCIDVLDKCLAEGKSRMRNYQRSLVEENLRVEAYPMGKIIDVDHEGDIHTANDFLSEPAEAPAKPEPKTRTRMSKYRIAAISRAGAFSPNHIGNDAAILHAVIDQLRRRGCEVQIYSEEQFATADITEEVVLDMCRRDESILKLHALEAEGKLVINSGESIENGTRERMTLLLLGAGVPYPESLIVDTNANALPRLHELGFEACWIKRGENHSQHKEDVSFCRHPQEVQEILHEFYYRGIRRAVINRHLPGDLIKFYGVADGSFFYWFYPLEGHHSKYGDELINGMPQHFHVDEEALKENALRAAKATGMEIFGGDCIVSPDGSSAIIDFNDWPSFAPCRDEAAPAIAKYVLKRIREHYPRTRRKEVKK